MFTVNSPFKFSDDTVDVAEEEFTHAVLWKNFLLQHTAHSLQKTAIEMNVHEVNNRDKATNYVGISLVTCYM